MAATEGDKELKLKRRSAKAKVTRLSNALQKLMDDDRDADEVNESFGKLKIAYQDLEDKHETYCETVLDDRQFELEDAWLEECHTAFIDSGMKVKDFVKNKSNVTADAESNNDRGGNVPVSRSESSSSTYDVSACRVQVERPKLPKFAGDVRDYTTFKSDFHHLIDSRYSKRDAITILRSCLQGKALDLIKGIGNNYDDAWAYLDSIYGDARFIADAIVNDLGKFRPLKEGEDTRFCDLVHLVKKSFNTLKEVNRTSDIDNSHMLALIERKMSPGDRRIWFRHVENKKVDVTFQHMIDWMTCEMRSRLRASAPLREGRPSSVSVSTVSEEEKSQQRQDFKCWICKSSEHWVDQCKKVLSKNQQQRYQLMRDNHACFSCLKRAGRDHNMKTCKRRKRCTERINGEQCQSFHHPLLHRDIQTTSENVAGVSGISGLLPVTMVKLRGSDRSMTANCLLDSGSQISLIRQSVADDMKLKGKPTTVNITKAGGDVEEIQGKLYKMRLQSIDDSKSYGVSAVGIPCITNDIVEADIKGLAKMFRLDERCLHRGSGPVDILVGIDHARMHTGETRCKGELVARHSPLGWVVFGTDAHSQSNNSTVLNIALANPVDLREFWTTESMGVCHNASRCQPYGLSEQETAEYKVVSDSCKKVGDQWCVSYPWQKDPELLQDNKYQAEKILHATERKLARNPEHAEAYDQQIKDMVEMDFAKKLTEDEMKSYAGPVHYISHHAIVRPEKKSTPIRIVFNSSAKYQGLSLNDFWMKGPDLLNSLFGVLLRFREHEVGLCADISKMYHRVMIPTADQHVHRFLWRNMNPERKPDVYAMKVVTFGDKSAPAMAQMALRKTAEEGKENYPEAAAAIKNNTYMDDICVSVPTVTEAKELSSSIDKVLAKGGFKVKGWRSNYPLTSEQMKDADDVSKPLESMTEEKVLGVVWNDELDIFSYKVKLQTNTTSSKRMSKRGILSQVARIFDPIGYAAAFVVRAKIGLQKLWEEGLDWDAELSEESQAEWEKLFQEMEKLRDVKFERCLTPRNTVGKPILCIFCDASMNAFGACAYLRWQVKDGNYEVRFVTAKSRVAPLKQLTVPRLELQAAVLASRLYRTITKELTMEIDDVIFMTDSTIALSWIRNSARKFKMFVATRVGEIHSSTDPSQWRHIPGEVNVADDITRGLNADQLCGRWQHGPNFLRRPKSEWPEEAKLAEKQPEVEKEKRKEQSILNVTAGEDVINCTRFSRWRKLVRVTSYVLKFVRKLKSRCKSKQRHTDSDTDTLTPEDIENGEAYLIRSAQVSLKPRVEKGEFKTLTPFIDETGIIRVGGRIDRAKLTYERRHPALLPYNHWLSTLITRHAHETGHDGVAATTAKVRRKYWILQGHKLIKTVKFRCTTCRSMEHKAESQKMSELPKERLNPNSPPFHYTACDYFGPLIVKFGRNKTTKHYGVLFTCLNTRAVHLELAVDCSTMEFLQVLRRFFAMRGQPAKMISDNGTQFVGAERELREMVKGWSSDKLREFCAEKGTEWTFVTPSAPHQNGCAESLVKSCKHALRKAIGEQILTPFELYTCLLETANLVNQRPIGRLPTEPDDGSYLSPNDMLLGRASSDVAQGPFRESRNPRHRVELVQGIVNTFWNRWTRDVPPLLVPRKKWNVDRRNVRIDDVVMLADVNAVRGKWTIARVIQVYPGPDGRVRNVKVKTPSAEYRRPVTKIAVIYPAEGYED